MKTLLAPSVFFGLTTMTSWGINSFLIASLTKKVGAFKAGFLIQTLTFFPTLLLLPLFKSQVTFGPDFFLISLPGVLGAISYRTYTQSYSEGKVSLVSPLTSTWSVVTAVLSFVFLKEKVIPLKMIGMAIAMAGIILVAGDFKQIFEEKKVKVFTGTKWAVLTALGWGITFFLLAFFSRKSGWYLTSLGLRFWTALFFLGFASLTRRSVFQLFQGIPRPTWIIILVDTFALASFNFGVTKGEPAVVSIISSTSPLIGVFLARVFLRETISLVQKLGIVLCLLGIASLSLV